MNKSEIKNPLLDVKVEMFKKGYYDFITVFQNNKHEKQESALQILNDNEHVEFLYGGAAGGAKSWTGCVWLLFVCLCYPETKWFIGRESLKRLRESTLLTFFKVAKQYGAKRGIDFEYNGQDHFIIFANGSRIDLLDLRYLPSDPLYERYGSIEYTGGWIEEGGEIDFGAYDTLKTRIGRHLNDKYNLLRKMFISCNPKKNWMYQTFYKPFKEHKLPNYMTYLACLVQENPFIEKDYIQALESAKEKTKRERLLLGNWEYEDDPALLVDYDAICDCFTNEHVKAGSDRSISADLAMKGRDRFVAGSWRGLVVRVAIDKPYSPGKMIETDLKSLMAADGVGRSRTVADSDGLGSFLESYIEGIKEFHNGAVAINSTKYANLKSECAYKLADVINKRELRIICTKEQEEAIKEELGVLKEVSGLDDTQKKRIISKEDMKAILGNSPDYLDMLIMGMYFLIKPVSKGIRKISF